MSKKILVIGDSCLDVFQYGICERLNPEAPVPILKPTKIIENGGMAENVISNVKALGYDCELLSNVKMPIKTRFIEENSNQMMLRMDENDDIAPIKNDELKLIDFSLYEAVIVVDYDKGYLSEEDIVYISKSNPLVFMDSKKEFGDWCKDVFCIKINEKEFKKNEKSLMEKFFGILVVTMGNRGAILKREEEIFKVANNGGYPVRDLSGAGDTFMAALVVKYLENKDISESIEFANKCASWVVTQRGVVPVDLNKI
jgi:D-beta-D-heptose 7-phosphate kinase/D-beta-D-heptose 1-phosphate adenosyltransferase